MALAKILSGTTVGLESVPVTVEVAIESFGFPGFNIVGLADKAVEESKERVRSAIKSSQLEFPRHRITVNLTPADLPKKGALFDLPIAVGILVASDIIPWSDELAQSLFFGELSLDGKLRSTPGAIALGMLATDLKTPNLFLPEVNANEAAFIKEINVFGLNALQDLIKHLAGEAAITKTPPQDFLDLLQADFGSGADFKEVRGQETAKRALEIAAAGGHNIAMTGPPGSGKTMLARALPSILPKFTPEEAFEVTKIYSVTGNLPPGVCFIKERPFRSPHHTTSRIGLIGGGSHPTPGEISLAHRGVLFLDEFPELGRASLEALRQPLEDGLVSISRAAGTLTFPAKFMLVVASNPCPCGFLGHPTKKCSCSSHQIENYKKRLSGPILDRIDLHLEVPPVEVEKLTDATKPAEDSQTIRNRVQTARNKQQNRFEKCGIHCNSEMLGPHIKEYCQLTSEGDTLIKTAVNNLALSARAYFRILKVARTIADLANSENVEASHLAEALQFRVTKKMLGGS